MAGEVDVYGRGVCSLVGNGKAGKARLRGTLDRQEIQLGWWGGSLLSNESDDFTHHPFSSPEIHLPRKGKYLDIWRNTYSEEYPPRQQQLTQTRF